MSAKFHEYNLNHFLFRLSNPKHRGKDAISMRILIEKARRQKPSLSCSWGGDQSELQCPSVSSLGLHFGWEKKQMQITCTTATQKRKTETQANEISAKERTYRKSKQRKQENISRSHRLGRLLLCSTSWGTLATRRRHKCRSLKHVESLVVFMKQNMCVFVFLFLLVFHCCCSFSLGS